MAVPESDQLCEACGGAEETEYGQTFEEHKRAREKPMDQRIDIQKPAVVARGCEAQGREAADGASERG